MLYNLLGSKIRNNISCKYRILGEGSLRLKTSGYGWINSKLKYLGARIL